MSTELVPVVVADLVIPAPVHADLLDAAFAGLAEQSREGYRKDLAEYARYIGADSPTLALAGLMALNRGQVNAVLASWVEHMTKGGLSPSTIRRRIAAVARVFKVARRFGLTETIPEVELPEASSYRDTSGPGERGWKKMLEWAQGAADWCVPVDVRNLAIVLLLHDRALRRGEVASADYPEDFDPTAPALQVLRKGKTVKVWLTISARAGVAVSRWLEVRGSEPGPLFTRLDTASKAPERLSGQAINEMVGTLGRRAKIGRTVRAHGLRHQAVTEALDKGWDVRDVKELSGHAKIDTVLIYDDRRKDVGGQISRDLAGESRGRRARRKAPGN